MVPKEHPKITYPHRERLWKLTVDMYRKTGKLGEFNKRTAALNQVNIIPANR